MKFLTTSLFLIIVSFSLQAQDYYWVGNGGNWSDLSHWATSSGGNTLHTDLPGSANNIIFDELSFTKEKEEVILDLDSMRCYNLTIKDITLKPNLKVNSYYDEFFIHGNLSISGNLSWGVVQNNLVGENETSISIETDYFGGFLIISPDDSLTIFKLENDLNASTVQINNGQLELNGFDVNAHEFRIGIHSFDGAPFVNFGNSKVRASRFIVHENGKLDAGSSEITIFEANGNSSNLFFGGGQQYYHVTFEGEIDRITDSNHFVEFRVAQASSLSFEDGLVQTAEQFIFDGTSSGPISVVSRNEGSQAIFHQSSGVVNGNYLILKDNTTSGAAVFNAYNSIDYGNVSGWNIEAVKPENYYWVGGSGEWSDLSHWSKSSDGNPNHIELPSAIDNVFFDKNSIQDEDGIVDIDLDAILVKNFSTVGLKSGSNIKIKSGSDGKFGIYGDILNGEGFTLNFKEINFLGDSIQTLSTGNLSFGGASSLKFESSATIELDGILEAKEISISKGQFKSNGHEIKVYGNMKLSKLYAPIIDLSNSKIDVKSWLPSGPDVDLNIDNTEITCSFIFYGENFNYNKVDFDGRNWVYGPFYTDQLTFSPRSEILILPGDTIKFRELIAIGNTTDSIKIASREPGEHAYLYSELGTVNGAFLDIKDNHAIGGATFIADNSTIEEMSVMGWEGTVSDVKNLSSPELLVYPNPSADYFWINPKNIDIKTLNVYNSTGQKVYSYLRNNNSSELIKVLTNNWPEGIYFLSSNNNFLKQKIVIARN